MTDAQVKSFVEMARSRGCALTRYDAALYLLCQEIFQREPGNVRVLSVLKELNAFIATGEQPTSFDEFYLPLPYTDEELAEHYHMTRDEYLSHPEVIA